MTGVAFETADTALCIMAEHIRDEMLEEGSSPLSCYQKTHGEMGLRSHIVEYLAPLFDMLWHKHACDVSWPFDLEFVPRLLEALEFNERGDISNDADKEAAELVDWLNEEFA